MLVFIVGIWQTVTIARASFLQRKEKPDAIYDMPDAGCCDSISVEVDIANGRGYQTKNILVD